MPPQPPPVAAWVLQPRTSTPQDDCWHCQNNPGYPHRHWAPKPQPPGAQPARADGWLWRLLYRIWGSS